MIAKDWPCETPPCPDGASTITAALSQLQPNTTVCTVTGKISGNTTPVLRDALTRARRDDNVHLVIDLSAVTSMDATGLYVFFEVLRKYSLRGGGHLAVVVDPNSQAIHELHIVALEAAFDLHHDLVRALHACASAGIATGELSPPDRRLPTLDERASTRPLIHQRPKSMDPAASTG
jgi:anti-anti-sigma factor